jgi:hypothetical protein
VSGAHWWNGVGEQRRARRAEQQAHAVEQHRRREHAEEEVLDAGLVRLLVALAPGGHHVGRDRQQFEGDEDADEVAGRRHHHHAEHAAQQQDVILALVVAALFERVLAHQHDHVGDEYEQCLEDECVVVDHIATVEQRTDRIVTDDRQRDDRDERCEHDEAGDRGHRPFLRLVEPQIDEQDEVDADDEDDLGREGVPVDRRRRPVVGLGEEGREHQPSVSPSWATRAVTAGSMMSNMSCG